MISVSCQSIARSEAEADAPASRTAGQIVVYTDWLWFREVQFTSVFVTVLQTQILLGVVTGAAFFLILHGNVTLARRLATREALVVADLLPGLPSPEILQPYLGRLTLPVSVTLALFAGWLGTGRWGLVLKALNPTPFGIRDPLFDQDVAFYRFWSSLYGWLMGVLVCLGSRRHRRVFLHPGHSGLPGGRLDVPTGPRSPIGPGRPPAPPEGRRVPVGHVRPPLLRAGCGLRRRMAGGPERTTADVREA